MRSNVAAGFVSKQAEQSAAASASLQASRAAHPGFIDIRPQALAQRKHQENAATSERSSQLRAISALMSGSPQSSRMQSLADRASAGSSRTASSTVQRKSFTSTRIDAQETGQTLQRVEDEEVLQARSEAVQRAEDEELVQGKFETVQRIEEEAEEENTLQAKFNTVQRAEEEEESLQGKFGTVQRVEDEELLQGKFSAPASTQLKEAPNNTGLPNQLKSGIESLSGMSMDHVRVHYNSAKPAQLHAHAYAQGSEIHMAPGQEQHLPHEAWHVVQQAQGRVKPTMQMKGNTPVNDDVSLETEADMMGSKALTLGHQGGSSSTSAAGGIKSISAQLQPVMQKARWRATLNEYRNLYGDQIAGTGTNTYLNLIDRANAAGPFTVSDVLNDSAVVRGRPPFRTRGKAVAEIILPLDPGNRQAQVILGRHGRLNALPHDQNAMSDTALVASTAIHELTHVKRIMRNAHVFRHANSTHGLSSSGARLFTRPESLHRLRRSLYRDLDFAEDHRRESRYLENIDFGWMNRRLNYAFQDRGEENGEIGAVLAELIWYVRRRMRGGLGAFRRFVSTARYALRVFNRRSNYW